VTLLAPAGSSRPGGRLGERAVSRHPGWPLTALLVPYPLWWALGMGTLIVFVLAVPMTVHLWRRRPVRVPPGFGLWLLFLLWVVLSALMLGVDPPGTLPGDAADRAVSALFNLAGYSVVGIAVLYVGNLTEDEYPRERLVRHLGWLFVVVAAGGLLGTYAPAFTFTSPVEWLLPPSVGQNQFVQSLVHPAAAQLQNVLGFTSGRPAAPFGYTNTWGYALTLLIGFFAISWLRRPGTRRLIGIVLLLLTVIPVVASLNRGVWIGLGLTVLFTAVWLARNGNLAGLVAFAVGLAVVGAVVLASPLTTVVQERLDNPHSDGVRAFTITKTLEATEYSPVLGFGSSRRPLGSNNSIAVGRDESCATCGNPPLGSTGQLWLLLISHGYVGTALYLGYQLRTIWAFRGDRSMLAGAAMLAIVLPLLYMLLYNAVAIPLLITFLGIGLLWRNDQERRALGRQEQAPVGVPAAATGMAR
jgi:O-Antigen ligase